MLTRPTSTSPSDWWSVNQVCQRIRKAAPFGKVNDPHDPGRHFTFYALQRNALETVIGPHSQFHEGFHGVRDMSLLEHYHDVLENAYASLLAQGLPPPRTDTDGTIRVYLCDVMHPALGEAPFVHDLATTSGTIISCLFLSCRPIGHQWHMELERLAAEAVHELRHAFNARQLPQRVPFMPELPDGELETMLRSWLWLDEALCVMTEADLLPDNLHWISFMNDWVDHCGCPVHADRHKYPSAMFTRYLSGKVEPTLLRDAWMHSAHVWHYVEQFALGNECEKPHTALTALAHQALARGHLLSHHTAADLFSYGYCFDSYFFHLEDVAPQTRNHVHATQVYERFKGQALTWSGKLHPAGLPPLEFGLPALSCHYLRIYPPHASTGGLTLRLHCSNATALRMEAVLVRGEFRVPGEWLLPLPRFTTADCDHADIIISHAPEIIPGYQEPPDAQITLHVSA